MQREVKQPKQFEGNIFTIYSPIKATVEKANTLTIDTELMLKLPEESKAFLTTKFTGQHIQNITGPVKQRLWITLLNESYFEKYTIYKGDVVGYLVFEPDNLKVQHEVKEKQLRQSSSSRTKRKYPSDYLPKKLAVEVEKILGKNNDDDRRADFSIAMTLHMQAEILSINSVKLLQTLSIRPPAKLTKLLSRELTR